MNITKDLILTPYLILSNGTKIDATQKFEPYGYRTMWDIVRSCALTIFACMWATIHPNIPSNRRSLSKFCYKLHLCIIGLIMPELLLLWAAKQYFAAWNLATRRRKEEVCSMTQASSPQMGDSSTATKKKGCSTSDWTTTQAFFALMGGFQDEEGHLLSPYASSYRITKPTDEEIQDKSKRDSFVKFLALTQALWFILVTIYRIQSPVLYATEAEIVTFTFGCISFITNIFWWNKPQGIDLPLTIAIDLDTIPSQQNPQATKYDRKDAPPPGFLKLAISILQSGNTPTHDEFILEPDVYAYVGELTLDNMTIAVLCAFLCGSLSGICHLTIASLNRGLTTTHGPIWFSFAFLGSALPFYLLLVIFIAFGLRAWDKKLEKRFLDYALNMRVQRVFLIVSVIGRIALFVALIYFMSTPYDYTAFLTPNWSQYIPHPF